MNHAAFEAPGSPFLPTGPAQDPHHGDLRSTDDASGEVRFVPDGERFSLLTAAERAARLPVNVPPPSSRDRGHLALVIEEAIEVALERRGASPPGLAGEGDLEASLLDQLYRARLVELRALVLFMGSLEALAGPEGALDAEDSRTLRFWLEATRIHPVGLYLDPTDRTLGVFPAPLPLGSLLEEPERDPGPATDPLAATPFADESPSRDDRELDDSSTELADGLDDAELDGDDEPHEGWQALELATLPGAAPSAELDPEAPVPAGDIAQALLEALGSDMPEAQNPSDDERVEADVTPEAAHQADVTPEAADAELDAAAAGEGQEPLAGEPSESADPPPQSERRPIELGPLGEGAAEKWPSWLRELENARGPKPLAAVERMFAKSYVPLRDAYLRGIAPADVAKVLDGWGESFAKSYSETFGALKLRAKRPTLVLDLPEVAHRIGRLHGAKSVQLLLVDGLRYDLGLRVERLLHERLGHELALAERLLYWAALPSDTASALELLGRGADALADIERSSDSIVPQARGRMARVPRRIKAGHRELLKLDLVEAELCEAGGPEPERLDALSLKVADSLAELIEKLPARTLLFAFGDHGFVLDWRPEGTTPAHHGGARPEEVLVPAFAWLVGGVQ